MNRSERCSSNNASTKHVTSFRMWLQGSLSWSMISLPVLVHSYLFHGLWLLCTVLTHFHLINWQKTNLTTTKSEYFLLSLWSLLSPSFAVSITFLIFSYFSYVAGSSSITNQSIYYYIYSTVYIKNLRERIKRNETPFRRIQLFCLAEYKILHVQDFILLFDGD